jgi:hypothetical protein
MLGAASWFRPALEAPPSDAVLPDSWTITTPTERTVLGLVVCATSAQNFGERQPRCCRRFRSCVSQQACYRFRNLLTSGLLVESETRGWVDLETIPATLWRTAQIDAREEQTQLSRKSAASLTQFRFERTCTDFGPTPGAAGVAVIVGVRDYLRGEDSVANNVDTVVGAGDVLLKLRGTVADVHETLICR